MKKILLATLLALSISSVYACVQGEITINGACVSVAYIPGCAQYYDANTCALCQYGYAISNQKCQYTEKPVTQCCVLIDSNGVCIQCAPGLYLDGSSCVKAERPGCLQGKGIQCTNCAQGYQNVKGRCYKKIVSCKNYAQNGLCTQCKQGFETIRGLCSQVASLPSILYCKSANEYGCTVCNEGTYLTKDRLCKINQAGCIKHVRQVCQICSQDYKLVSGRCVMDGCAQYGNNGCARCSSPYVAQNNKCVLQNCLQSTQGRCLICQGQYRIKNGKCVKAVADRCTTCANGYFVGQDGKCYKNINGCLSYGDDGKCRKCTDSFAVNDGSCTIPGCDKIGAKGCQICFRPFTLLNGRCVIDKCADYNYQTRRCRSCSVGYHIQQGVCVQNHNLCASYSVRDFDQVCSSCISDNYIINEFGICQKRKPGCVYQYGKCITCAAPFKRVSDVCMIQGCLQYDSNGCSKCNPPFTQNGKICIIKNCDEIVDGKCKRCSSGFRFNSGLCVQNDPKCAAYSGQSCSNCISGFKLTSQGFCVRQIPYCKVQSSDRCNQCQGGYQISNGICVVIDRYCQAYNSKFQGCIRCSKGYHTESGVCKINDVYCASYQYQGYSQKCTQCISGYVFTSDKSRCVKQSPGCIYNDQGICFKCRSPFTFNGNSCVIYGCTKYTQTGCYQCEFPASIENDKCVISFCDQYSTSSTSCQKCIAGYRLSDGKCYRQDTKCVQYSKNGECTKCINGFITFEGVCIKQDIYCSKYSKDGGCNKCKDKYYISPDLICLPEEPGCIYQKGKCAYCNYPFKFYQPSQKCRIDGCLQATSDGCTKCREPFKISSAGVCEISNCVTVQDNHCKRCTPGYHLKQGMTCVRDDKSCLKYNEDGDCQICDKGYMLMSSGQCEVAEDNCIQKSGQNKQCTACKSQFFLNKFFQCQKKDINCQEYNNGVCVTCTKRFFLYQYICFPYSPGCVSYAGKDCNKCKSSYTIRNGQCFNLKKPSLQLQGQDEKYDFDITPIDITKSKYYIDNLSPASKLAKIFYSSFFSIEYTDARLVSEEQNLYPKGWKALNPRSGQYIGYTIVDSDPATFYAIQIQGIQGNYIKEFYLQYSVDSINYIRIDKVFNSEGSSKNLTTIYFTGVYASSIRIIVKTFVGWPAARIEFFYYDVLRFRKISNLKSLKYLKESIQSNFVDRMDNQMYINQRAYFNPAKQCQNKSVCFSGLELCQQRTINSVSIGCTSGTLKKLYITYSIDGLNFNCYEKCRYFQLDESKQQNLLLTNGLLAKNLRVYPVQWTGLPSIKISYDYL